MLLYVVATDRWSGPNALLKMLKLFCSVALKALPLCSGGITSTMLQRSYPLRPAPELSPKQKLHLRRANISIIGMASGQLNRTKEATACFKQASVFQSQDKYKDALQLWDRNSSVGIKTNFVPQSFHRGISLVRNLPLRRIL
jgi:hypothetical protein